jgi:DNA-directed RNA polymerase subunit RPC12/RpoP
LAAEIDLQKNADLGAVVREKILPRYLEPREDARILRLLSSLDFRIRMIKRQITCTHCNHDMFFDRFAEDLGKSSSLIYVCPSCGKTVTLPLAQSSTETAKKEGS